MRARLTPEEEQREFVQARDDLLDGRLRASLGKLETLNLGSNQIGDEGIKAFSAVIASGSLGSLKELYLYGNQIGYGGMKAFSDAIASGALGKLKKLSIGNPSAALRTICSSKKVHVT